jgi:fimbrial chaperone protein
MISIAKHLFTGLVCLGGLASVARANFEVQPFILKLRADRGELSGWLEVKPNQDKRPVAVELKLHERILDINGLEDQNSPESRDLTVYPSELVVYPGEKVKVQVVWNGKTAPPADRTYTILAQEVPINLNQPIVKDRVEVEVKTLVRYRLVVALETGKRGSLSVVSSKKIEGDSSEIIVENRGAGRIPMDGFRLLVGGKTYSGLGFGNAIMPGDKRRFVLPLPNPPAVTDIRFGASGGPIK